MSSVMEQAQTSSEHGQLHLEKGVPVKAPADPRDMSSELIDWRITVVNKGIVHLERNLTDKETEGQTRRANVFVGASYSPEELAKWN